jgi:hypothetical protein
MQPVGPALTPLTSQAGNGNDFCPAGSYRPALRNDELQKKEEKSFFEHHQQGIVDSDHFGGVSISACFLHGDAGNDTPNHRYWKGIQSSTSAFDEQHTVP